MSSQKLEVEVPIDADLNGLSSRTRAILPILRRAMDFAGEAYKIQDITPFYPKDLTKAEFEAYIAAHPEQKEELNSPFTYVVRNGEKLQAVPYSEAHSPHLAQAADQLELAAKQCDDKLFAEFLYARARSMRDNSFSTSDILWISMVGTELEMTIGPYEEYEDRFMDIKRNFEAFLSIQLPEENRRINDYRQAAQDFDQEFSKVLGYSPSGSAVNMVVVDSLYVTGRSVDKFVPMAFNLPNDYWIRQKFGSKQVFLRNVMKAKYENLFMPIARRIAPKYLERLSFDLKLKFVIGHELSHGLGIYCKIGLAELGSELEESKADIWGLKFLAYQESRGKETEGTANSVTIMHLIDCFRQLHRDPEEAHAKGALLHLNWFIEQGALKITAGELEFDEAKLYPCMHALAMSFAYVAMAQSYDRAKQFIERWGYKSEAVDSALAKLDGIPNDIRPVYSEF